MKINWWIRQSKQNFPLHKNPPSAGSQFEGASLYPRTMAKPGEVSFRQISMKTLISWKFFWKCRLRNSGHLFWPQC